MHQNKKEDLLNAPNTPMWFIKTKYRSKNYEIYRRRQAIVEHPYGVIKRQWGFYYNMTKKTIKHASADVGLIFTAQSA
jgi:hypothetical protein